MRFWVRYKSVPGAALQWSGSMLAHLITLPYYRFFRQNTLIPIQSIARAIENGQDDFTILKILGRWKERKLYELHFIQIAATLLSGAVIGCFSWAPRDQEHWIGPASWYTCLVLSLFAILLSSSQVFIFSTIKSADNAPPLASQVAIVCSVHQPLDRVHTPSVKSGDSELGPAVTRISRRARIRWNMVFTWQAPMMLLAYSVMAFMAGVTTYVCTPLYADEKSLGGGEAAIFYLAWFTASAGVFVWCSFWAYKFVDLEGF